MWSPKVKRNIARIFPFGVIWFITGCVFLYAEYAAAGGSFSNVPETAIKLSPSIFAFAMVFVFFLGLFIGTIELVYLNNAFIKRSFWQKILFKSLVYASLMFIIIGIAYPIAASMEEGIPVWDREIWKRFGEFLTTITFRSTALQMSFSLLLCLFYAEISSNIGPRVLVNFLSGKYHQPQQEKRIFMFADMKSSTTIAEKLGHSLYFELLREYYFDLTPAIVKYEGEIYQYVGDEIVISWKLAEGLRKNQCIQCYYAMKEGLKKKKQKYLDKFGVLPDFKAGFHVGEITTGEIGAEKKEIIFTGDVLNATARIQALCKSFQVDIILSKDLVDKLDLDKESPLQSLGFQELRGKEEKLELFTLT